MSDLYLSHFTVTLCPRDIYDNSIVHKTGHYTIYGFAVIFNLQKIHNSKQCGDTCMYTIVSLNKQYN